MTETPEKDLLEQHTKHGVLARLAAATQHSYLGDILLGAKWPKRSEFFSPANPAIALVAYIVREFCS